MIKGLNDDIKQLREYNHTLNDLIKESDDNEISNNNNNSKIFENNNTGSKPPTYPVHALPNPSIKLE